MSDALCDEVDLSQFCQHVSVLVVYDAESTSEFKPDVQL